MINKTILLATVIGTLFTVGLFTLTTTTSRKVFASPATEACAKAPDNPYCNALKSGQTKNPVTKTIGNVVQLFALIGGVVAVIWIIYGGFKFVLSDGDSGRIQEARKTIIYGVVGLVVLLMAQILVTFILNAVTK
ncbi:MAG: pilin [Candidatus Saccharibacteria bacterium]